jgi:ubiquinone/menaquinone biosynthesis C-methylase UbiE
VSVYSDHIFPHLLALVSSTMDDDRRELLRHARGRVLELGVGTGANLPFYDGAVREVVGIDPHEPVLGRAREVAEKVRVRRGVLPYRLRLHLADAQALPYDDASFDTVVAFLTFCTIPDPAVAAGEVWRVLRPGGRLLVLEHVRAEENGRLARWQDRLDPLWRRAALGCRLNRPTARTLADAGFDTRPLERYRDQTFFPPASPRIRGVLFRPGAVP